MANRGYELRNIGEKIIFNGEELTIRGYGESVDYFVAYESGLGFYLDEWQLNNSRCVEEEDNE